MASTHSPEDPCTTLHLPHALDTVDTARSQMMADLEPHHLSAELLQDAELVLVELVANAWEHGNPDAAGQVEVSWCLLDQTLRISVVDGGLSSGRELDLQPRPRDPAALRGRGLMLVDYLCSNWTADTQGRTRVTAELTLT